MSFAFIVVAICFVPVTGIISGLLELAAGDARRRSIVDAFDRRAADMSHC